MQFPWKKQKNAEQGTRQGAASLQKSAGIDWFWSLTVDGVPTAVFDWQDVLRGLENLRPDPDSFLILERRNPEEPRESGFLQCAVNLGGARPGWYTVECGYPSAEGEVLLRKDVPSPAEAAAIFEAVYRQMGAVFSGFSDLSETIGQG